MNDNLLIQGKHKLVVTIVKKGTASKILETTKKAGAEGGTILMGRGTAKKSIYLDLLGINFDTEKEVIFTICDERKVDDILEAIVSEAKLKKPGNGISFVVNINALSGVVHLLKNQL